MYKRTFIDYFLLFLKGIAMGAANKVPGVSGGMVSLVMGFYEELIYTFQKFNGKALKLLQQKRYDSFFKYINAKFLISVFAGSITAYFTVSLLLDYLIRNYQLIVWSVFFGMVIGSVYYVGRKIEKYDYKTYIIIVLGAAIGLYISFLDPMPPNTQLWFVFLCGVVSVSGMTLPGFSGSFILIILGNYILLMVDSVNNLTFMITHVLQGDFSVFSNPNRMHLLYIILTFTLGGLTGLIIFSKMMGYLLKNFHDYVLAALMGFIIGSLGATWPWKDMIYKKDALGNYVLSSNGEKIIETYKRYFPQEFDVHQLYAILAILLGIASILVIIYYENKREPRQKVQP